MRGVLLLYNYTQGYSATLPFSTQEGQGHDRELAVSLKTQEL